MACLMQWIQAYPNNGGHTMDRYMERTAHRLEVAAEERRCWAIGYNDAMSAITRSTWAWTPAERQSYHYGWMTRMGAL